MSEQTKVLYEFGRFRCDPGEHLLLRNGRPLPLSPKAFEILVVLIQSNGRLMTKDELMHKVWPDTFVEEANLTVNISALRKVLGENPEGQPYIETVPKRGYRFLSPVIELGSDRTSVNVPAQASNSQQGVAIGRSSLVDSGGINAPRNHGRAPGLQPPRQANGQGYGCAR